MFSYKLHFCFYRPPIPTNDVVRVDGVQVPTKQTEFEKTPPLPPKSRNSLGSKPVGIVAPFNVHLDVSLHINRSRREIVGVK